MERRKFLKGMAVLAILPIVGIVEEEYTLTSDVDWDALANKIKDMDIRHTHTFGVAKERSQFVHNFVCDMDFNSMYMMKTRMHCFRLLHSLPC